jgi:hypothetical protein
VTGRAALPAGPAGNLRGTVEQALTDLAVVEQHLSGATAGQARQDAGILERLAGELAEAAAMIGSLPGHPSRGAQGRTLAAVTVLAAGVRREPDAAAWVAGVLRAAAREPGAAALTAAPPPSWEAWLIRQLINGDRPAPPPPGASGDSEARQQDAGPARAGSATAARRNS